MAVDTEAKRWGMMQWASGPSAYSTLINPDTSGVNAIERATFLKLYGGIAFSSGAQVEAAVVTGVFDITNSATQDWTAPDFGDVDCAVVFGGVAGASNNPAAGMTVSIGLWDGTNQQVAGLDIQDDEASGPTPARNAQAAQIYGDGFYGSGHDVTISAITDGIRLTTTAAGSTEDKYGSALLLKGVQNATQDSVNLGTGTSEISVSLGFKPSLIFAVYTNLTGETSSGTHAQISFGIAHIDSSDTITQRCVAFFEDYFTTTTSISTQLRTDCIAAEAEAASNASIATITSVDSDGFGITPSANAGSTLVYYLAVQLGDPDDAWLGTLDAATSTGDDANTSPGFDPTALLVAGSMNTTVNSFDDGGGLFIGLSDSVRSRALNWFAEDAITIGNPPVSNAKSLSADQLIQLYTHDGTLDVEATLSSFDTNGWTANYSNAATSAYKWMALAIDGTELYGAPEPEPEEEEGPSPTGGWLDSGRIPRSYREEEDEPARRVRVRAEREAMGIVAPDLDSGRDTITLRGPARQVSRRLGPEARTGLSAAERMRLIEALEAEQRRAEDAARRRRILAVVLMLS